MKKTSFPWAILDEAIQEIAGPRPEKSAIGGTLVDALRGPRPTGHIVPLDNPPPRILQFPVSREGYTKGA
jgi:hypothetical protein